MRQLHVLALAVVLPSCSTEAARVESAAPRPSLPVERPLASTVVSKQASSSLEDLATRFPGAAVLATTIWPSALPGDDVVAVLLWDDRAGTRYVSWFRAPEHRVPEARRYPVSPSCRGPVGSIDLDGDGRLELLLFCGADGSFGSIDAFALGEGIEQPLALGPLAAALDGAADFDEVAARLPLDGSLDDRALASATTAAIVGRLALLPLTDLRAMTSRRGIEICRHYGEQETPVDCRRVEPRALTDHVLRDDLQMASREALDPLSVMSFQCHAGPRELCVAYRSGGTSITIELEGKAAARRVTRVVHRDEGLGE